MRRVYSYIRFSTPEQAEGHSLQRQTDYAQRYAEQNGLILDESLSLRDEGLSAYHQTHIRRGALGAFLRAVEDGLVPSGSILIVEGLDRLSRAEPILSQAQLSQIINAGITVVTASDGKSYSRESLKSNPMDLVYSLLIMIRAHEESDTKSRRVRQSIHARIERWLDGREKGIIRQGRDPRWVQPNADKTGFELIPECADGVRFIVQKYLAGWGAVRITEAMNEGNLSAGTKQMNRGTVYRIIRNPALVGENRLEIDGQLYRLPGYYPPVITEATFHELQACAGQREAGGRTSPVPAILTGIQTAYCGYCGRIMVGQNSLNKMRPDGTLPEYARRIMCCDASHWRRCPVTSSANVSLLERAVLEYCADSLNLSSLIEDSVLASEAQARLNKSVAAHAEATAAIARMTEQFLKMDKVPAAFTTRVNELESEVQILEQEIDRARSEATALRSKSSPDLIDQWQLLKTASDALDAEARLQVRELIRQTFRRIDVFLKGFGGSGDEGIAQRIAQRIYRQAFGGSVDDSIDLVLHGRSGRIRILAINRKTGAWQAGSEFEAEALQNMMTALMRR